MSVAALPASASPCPAFLWLSLLCPPVASSYPAHLWCCRLDMVTGRPTLALLVVCAGMFDPWRVDSAVSVITHELIHLLVRAW